MFVASKVNPKIIPNNIIKKIVSIRPKFNYRSATGNSTKIETPYPTLSKPKARYGAESTFPPSLVSTMEPLVLDL